MLNFAQVPNDYPPSNVLPSALNNSSAQFLKHLIFFSSYFKVFRFQTLLSLMLSSQTKDHITAAAMHVSCNPQFALKFR